jgi:hypothetical protein
MREKRWTELLVATAFLLSAAGGFAQGVPSQSSQVIVNDGNLVMEDVPPIPGRIVDDLVRYQNTRAAWFLDWTGTKYHRLRLEYQRLNYHTLETIAANKLVLYQVSQIWYQLWKALKALIGELIHI